MKLIYLSLITCLITFSCEKADPVIPNEEELITTLIYQLDPVGGSASVELKFQDLDGDGGNAPVITTEPLAASTVYTGTLILKNELTTPAVDISAEVRQEGDLHQLFYIAENADLSISYEDEDLNGNPLGLSTTVSTGTASTGVLTIALRHLPKKPNSGPVDAGGETDIEVVFDVIIE